MENIPVKRNYHVYKITWPLVRWKHKKDHTMNSSEILMWKISLFSYNMIYAIADELSHSQASLTLNYFESSKRSHKGQCLTYPNVWCRRYPFKDTWYRHILKSYQVHNVLLDTTCHLMTIPLQPKKRRGKNQGSWIQ